jgi:hypothetical protein
MMLVPPWLAAAHKNVKSNPKIDILSSPFDVSRQRFSRLHPIRRQPAKNGIKKFFTPRRLAALAFTKGKVS